MKLIKNTLIWIGVLIGTICAAEPATLAQGLPRSGGVDATGEKQFPWPITGSRAEYRTVSRGVADRLKIPADEIASDARDRVVRVVNHPTLFATGPAQVFAGDLRL